MNRQSVSNSTIGAFAATDGSKQRKQLMAKRNLITPIVLGLMTISIGMLSSNLACADQPTLDNINQLIRDGQNAQAASELQSLDDAIKSGDADEVDLTVPLALVARALEEQKDWESAAKLYERAVVASNRISAKDLKPSKLALVRLAASSVFVRTKKYSEAMELITDLVSDHSPLTDQQKQIAGELCLHIGANTLSTEHVLAQRAYQLAASVVTPEKKPTALLGEAWALAASHDSPADAAKKLQSFISEYPEHKDVAQAAALRVNCLRQAGATDDAESETVVFLQRWPDSKSAANLISHSIAKGQVSAEVELWLLNQTEDKFIATFSPAVSRAALVVAAKKDTDQAKSLWGRVAKHLAATDLTGQATSDALQDLNVAPTTESARQFCAGLLNKELGSIATTGSREAAARWAGRTRNWKIVADAAVATKPGNSESNRSVTVERLFAESLMQTNQQQNAAEWWNHLVDERGVDDFATLLRCAETATAVGNIDEAGKRIDAAHAVTANDESKLALVNMLSAELSIRKLKFDQARALLENVVQSAAAKSSLRSRAQWMIGETYYLQQKFVDAIEAYRKVEGIDPEGEWVSVALIQAGKAFEHLGRSREASVCYSTLVGQFSDSQHAAVARTRLAKIGPVATATAPKTDTIQR